MCVRVKLSCILKVLTNIWWYVCCNVVTQLWLSWAGPRQLIRAVAGVWRGEVVSTLGNTIYHIIKYFEGNQTY